MHTNKVHVIRKHAKLGAYMQARLHDTEQGDRRPATGKGFDVTTLMLDELFPHGVSVRANHLEHGNELCVNLVELLHMLEQRQARLAIVQHTHFLYRFHNIQIDVCVRLLESVVRPSSSP